jgi:hypothetical protein
MQNRIFSSVTWIGVGVVDEVVAVAALYNHALLLLPTLRFLLHYSDFNLRSSWSGITCHLLSGITLEKRPLPQHFTNLLVVAEDDCQFSPSAAAAGWAGKAHSAASSQDLPTSMVARWGQRAFQYHDNTKRCSCLAGTPCPARRHSGFRKRHKNVPMTLLNQSWFTGCSQRFAYICFPYIFLCSCWDHIHNYTAKKKLLRKRRACKSHDLPAKIAAGRNGSIHKTIMACYEPRSGP